MDKLEIENEALKNRIIELEHELNKDKPSGNAEEAFERARVLFQGRKRGFTTEFNNFIRHPDWREVVFELESAVKAEQAYRRRMLSMDEFTPQMKNFVTWINQRCFEYEFPTPTTPNQPQRTSDDILKRMQDKAREEGGI